MNDLNIAKAPGCFGSASVYSQDGEMCQRCVAFTECGHTAIQSLATLRTLVDVTDIIKRHQAARHKANNTMAPPRSNSLEITTVPVTKALPVVAPILRQTTKARVTFEISQKDQNVIAMIGKSSVKAMEQAVVLCKYNLITEGIIALKRQENPFAKTGPAWLRVACAMLLEEGFTKASLRERLVKDLEWTDGTAASHVSMAWFILASFKIAVFTDNKFVLNPDLRVENVI